MLNIDKAKHKKILKISLPTALYVLLDMLQVIADLVMVGTISVFAISAVGVGLQLLIVGSAILTVLQVGTNALISRFYGAKKMKQGSLALATLLQFSFYLSFPITFLWYFASNTFYVWINVEAQVLELGTAYVTILTIMIPFTLLKSVFVTALYATGDSTTPMYLKILLIIVNIFLNYILIFGNFGSEVMGVAGAAIATVIVNVIEVLVYIWLYITGKTVFRPLIYFSKNLLNRVLKIGLPSTYERMLTSMSFLLFIFIITDYSTQTLAGYQIGLRVEGIAFMPGIGFTFTAMVLMGQGLGAKNPEQSRKDVLLILKYASGLMFFLSFFMLFTPEIIVQFFTNNKKTIEEASLYLQILGLAQIPLAFNFVLSGALRGAGDSTHTLRINLTSLWLIRIIPAFILSWYFHNIIWVYIAIISDIFVRAFFLWKAFNKGDWKKIKV